MRRYAPAIVLFLLAPLMAEVLFGATTLSRIGGLLVVAPLYGGGALLIRELARRRGLGWGRIALLGAAYGLVEEGLALQSLFDPDLFNAGLLGGRALGVNWVWTEWALGYHIVWSIMLPILLAELLFPARRTEPWLGRVGLPIAGVLYLLGAVASGAIFRFVITPGFRAAPVMLAITALAVVLLVALALVWPAKPAVDRQSRRAAPSPWVVGLVILVVAIAWFALLGLPDQVRHNALVLAPVLLEAALAAGVAVFLRRWSNDRGWADLHRFAALLGALLVSMLVGFFFVTASNRVDQLFQGCACLVALVLLAAFAGRLRQRQAVAEPATQLS